MKNFIRAAVLAGVFFGLVPASAMAQATSDKPVQGGTLTVGFASDSKTLDPLFSVQSTERQVLYLVFNSLVKFGTDFSIKPELAESWTVSKDGRKVIFKLRSGVKFHDGTVFDAAAVKWNIDARLDPAIASSQREQLLPIIDSVEVVDPLTVAFNLKGSFPGLLSLLGERPGFMISPTAWKKSKQDFGSNPVGTGPFVFREWVRGSQLALERNASYWEKGLPYLDKITFKDIGGSVAGTQRLITGEIDFVPDLSPQEIRQIETRPNIRLMPINIGRWYSAMACRQAAV
jgi:peptide/nickel transport system substrate-binding protein